MNVSLLERTIRLLHSRFLVGNDYQSFRDQTTERLISFNGLIKVCTNSKESLHKKLQIWNKNVQTFIQPLINN
jgi:urease accessory protein UreF